MRARPRAYEGSASKMSKPAMWLLPRGGGARVKLTLPYPDADHALAQGMECECGAEGELGVQGSGRRPSDDDRAWEADGYAACCKRPVGLIRIEPSTLFGVREDQAVLCGRARVY